MTEVGGNDGGGRETRESAEVGGRAPVKYYTFV